MWKPPGKLHSDERGGFDSALEGVIPSTEKVNGWPAGVQSTRKKKKGMKGRERADSMNRAYDLVSRDVAGVPLGGIGGDEDALFARRAHFG